MSSLIYFLYKEFIIIMSDSGQIEVLQSSNWELIEASMREDPNKSAPVQVYQVKIQPIKSLFNSNLLQSQYYQFQLYKFEQKLKTIKRRYSDFAVLFDILSKRQPGFIFPAFPENGIFAFMKSKVTVAKDEAFVATRIKVIERFFTKLLNDPEYNPQTCEEIKVFLSEEDHFETMRQIERSSVVGSYITQLWNVFSISKENKYKEHEARILELKGSFQGLHTQAHELMRLLQQEKAQNGKLQQLSDPGNYLFYFKQLLVRHDSEQELNLIDLQNLQFALFCENEDLLMAKRIIDRMNQMRKKEESYGELEHTEKKFNSKIDNFLIDKAKTRIIQQEELEILVKRLKGVSRFQH